MIVLLERSTKASLSILSIRENCLSCFLLRGGCDEKKFLCFISGLLFLAVDQALQQSAKLDLKKVVVGASSLGLFRFSGESSLERDLKGIGGLEGNYDTLGEILVVQFQYKSAR
jgi:hypothetical protein